MLYSHLTISSFERQWCGHDNVYFKIVYTMTWNTYSCLINMGCTKIMLPVNPFLFIFDFLQLQDEYKFCSWFHFQIIALCWKTNKSKKNYTIQHDIKIKEGIVAIKFHIFILQREITTATNVFEKYNICKYFFSIF
jgi:hypothetical protein